MLTSRNLQTKEDIIEWTARLDREWPERRAVIRQIIAQVAALPFPKLHVVELGTGPGQLAEALLAALPQVDYTGFDRSELLVAYAQKRLAAFGERARVILANLNETGWLETLAEPVQAVVSMQSLHDLGGEAEVNRIYGLGRELLVPGGLFLNADLVVPPGEERPNNPGRRSVPRHLALLRQQEYGDVACILQEGEFGGFAAFAPSENNEG